MIVLTESDLATLVAENRLSECADNPSRLLVAVFENPADRARLKPVEERRWTPEVLAVGTRAAYLWCPDGILRSPLAKAVGRVLGDAVTTRNRATVRKLCALAADRGT